MAPPLLIEYQSMLIGADDVPAAEGGSCSIGATGANRSADSSSGTIGSAGPVDLSWFDLRTSEPEDGAVVDGGTTRVDAGFFVPGAAAIATVTVHTSVPVRINRSLFM